MDIDVQTQVNGRVLLYTSQDMAEPFMAFCQDVTPDFPVILERLSERYSPVKSRCISLHLVSVSLSLSLEFNYCMYVHEDNIWTGKGCFNNVLKDHDPVQWDFNDKGAMTLSILTVIFQCGPPFCFLSNHSSIRMWNQSLVLPLLPQVLLQPQLLLHPILRQKILSLLRSNLS